MSKKYFGKGCYHLVCQFESDVSITDNAIPELVYCKHPLNKEDSEGNCREELCPIRKYKQKNKKVYCGDCKFIVSCGSWGLHKRCGAGEIEKDYMGDKMYLTKCRIKNQNNDCKDYKRKWWKFWI